MYNAPIKAKYAPKQINTPSMPMHAVSSNVISGNVMGEIYQLVNELKQIINVVNSKVEEMDGKIKDHTDTAKALKDTQIEVIKHVRTILKGEKGNDADEESIVRKVANKFPNKEQLTQEILAKVPKSIDEEALTQKLIKALPQNKASLKIIQESFEVDPMSVIEKIMALPPEKLKKLKLRKENIDGLEQTMSAFNNQLGRGYLHGGGTTVAAGTNVTLVKNPNGTTTINAASGGGVNFADNEIVTGSGTSFTLAHTPIAGSQSIYGEGQLLEAGGVDYTISGTNLTMINPWNAGQILANYRY